METGKEDDTSIVVIAAASGVLRVAPSPVNDSGAIISFEISSLRISAQREQVELAGVPVLEIVSQTSEYIEVTARGHVGGGKAFQYIQEIASSARPCMP